MTPLSDRNNPESAAEILSTICRSREEQTIVLGQLLRSVSMAEDLSLNSWSVTLLPHGFRLNVGPVEVFALLDRTVRLLLMGALPEEADKLGKIEPCEYRSVPQPQHAFIGSIRKFQKAIPHLEGAHRGFIRAAALTADGKPRRATYIRYHSPGLYTYAKQVMSEA